jgi:hypothetical protein
MKIIPVGAKVEIKKASCTKRNISLCNGLWNKRSGCKGLIGKVTDNFDNSYCVAFDGLGWCEFKRNQIILKKSLNKKRGGK